MVKNISYEKEKVSFNVARLKKGGQVFEVAIEPDVAMAYKKGTVTEIRDAIRSEKIFNDVKKGVFAPEHTLQQLFETTDVLKIADKILKEGEIQLSTEYRAMLREQKKKRILALIQRNAMDPSTKLPHPPARIEAAFDEAKCHVDEHKNPEEQVEDIIKMMRKILPISIETLKAQVHVPASHAHQSFRIIKSYGTILSEAWGSDGSLTIKIEMPAGLQEEFLDKLNHMTHGGIEFDVLK